MAGRRKRTEKKRSRKTRSSPVSAPAKQQNTSEPEHPPVPTDEETHVSPARKWHDGLKPSHRRFVERYVKHGNATRAYREAGYESKNPDVDGPALLGNPRIQKAIQLLQDRAAMRAEVSIAECLTRYNLRAKANLADFVEPTPQGDRIRSLPTLPRHKTAAVRSLTTEEKFLPDGTCVVKTKIELYDGKASDDSIMKHLGGFLDKTEITGKDGGPVQVENLTPEQRKQRLAELLSKRHTPE